MYTASRNSLSDHINILEKLNQNEGNWYETYLKIIDNVCSTNDMSIEDIKTLLDTEYTTKEYAYDVDPSLGLNMIEHVFETEDDMLMIQYIKEKDAIYNVFYNDKDINTIYTVVREDLIQEDAKLHTGILTRVDSLEEQNGLIN